MKHVMQVKGTALIAVPVFIVAAFLTLSGCQTNPATGERQLNFLSTEQEIQLGQQSDQQIRQTMGVYPDEDLQEYIDALGKGIAATTERPDLPWTFRVIDDETVNAFALPGGFIYITRGMLAHMNNGAELAGVLGHEIAHVTAQHSANQLSRMQLGQLGLGIALVLEPGLAQFAPLASAGMQLLFLKFGREDELQADELGVRYMSNIQEDPQQMKSVMETLRRVTERSQGGRLPEWLSTHPYPENRQENISEAIENLEQSSFNPVEREAYFRMIDGIVYGNDPREGYSRGDSFFHPALRFRMNFPENWRILNQKQAVIAISETQDAALQLTLGQGNSLEESARTFFTQEGVDSQGSRSVRINGLPAVTGMFTAQTQQGPLAGRATFIRYNERIYQLVAYSMQNSWSSYDSIVTDTMYSFRELNDPEALSVEPLRLDVVRIPERMTLREFTQRYPSPAASIEEIALINQLEPDSILESGQLVKRVEGERFEE